MVYYGLLWFMADVYSQIGNGLIEHLGFEPYFHIKLAMNMGYPPCWDRPISESLPGVVTVPIFAMLVVWTSHVRIQFVIYTIDANNVMIVKEHMRNLPDLATENPHHNYHVLSYLIILYQFLIFIIIYTVINE